GTPSTTISASFFVGSNERSPRKLMRAVFKRPLLACVMLSPATLPFMASTQLLGVASVIYWPLILLTAYPRYFCSRLMPRAVTTTSCIFWSELCTVMDAFVVVADHFRAKGS